MILPIAGILLLLPPWGTIFGIVTIVITLILDLHVITSRLILTPDELRKQSLFLTHRIARADIKKVERIKVIGTATKAPIAIRQIIFAGTFGTKDLGVLIFPWFLVADIIEVIKGDLADEIGENS